MVFSDKLAFIAALKTVQKAALKTIDQRESFFSFTHTTHGHTIATPRHVTGTGYTGYTGNLRVPGYITVLPGYSDTVKCPAMRPHG